MSGCLQQVNVKPFPGLAVNYLAERGLRVDYVMRHGVEIDTSPTNDRCRERLGFGKLEGGGIASLVGLGGELIWFPCRGVNGDAASWIARPLPAIGETKFLNRKGEALPFILPETWEAKDKPHRPIVITEGPVKALSIAHAGHLSIGIGGVWMATRKAEEKVELTSALTGFEWSGRCVYLGFDADSGTNSKVRQALVRTWLVFYAMGARVRLLSWPLSEAKGIDDFLHRRQQEGEGPSAALGKLMEDAKEIQELLQPEDLTIVQRELGGVRLKSAQLSQVSKLLSVALRVKPSALEADAIENETDGLDRKFDLKDPEPWPEEVNGTHLLSDIIKLLRRHVVITEHQAAVCALWLLMTYVEAWVDILPILAITSPEKRCGKTTLMSIVKRLARKSLAASSITTSALFRSIEKWTPTLLIDEADTFLKDDQELRGVLNSGHSRDMAYVLRTNTETLEPEYFSTWCPKAIACIGKLYETLTDRSIELRLERKTKEDIVSKLRDAVPEEFEQLSRQAMRWALDNGDKVRGARPPLPSSLNDRAADNWFPLLAIAEVAGFQGAIKATLALSNEESDESITLQLLLALNELFRADPFVPTDKILEALNRDKEAPWADWKNGLTAEKLAKTLKSFGVKSRQFQKDGSRHRGYFREGDKGLQHVFDRYLSSCPLHIPENEDQPVHSSVDQVPELFGGCTGLNNEPVHEETVHEFNESTCAVLSDSVKASYDEVHGLDPQNGGKGGNEERNGRRTSDPPFRSGQMWAAGDEE
jgi:uncharacterized protein DUF3631/uncharacterized protein DUF3854